MRMSGGCEYECAQCDIGAHCGRKSHGCRFFVDEDEEENDDDEEEEEEDIDDD